MLGRCASSAMNRHWLICLSHPLQVLVAIPRRHLYAIVHMVTEYRLQTPLLDINSLPRCRSSKHVQYIANNYLWRPTHVCPYLSLRALVLSDTNSEEFIQSHATKVSFVSITLYTSRRDLWSIVGTSYRMIHRARQIGGLSAEVSDLQCPWGCNRVACAA